MAQPDTVPVIFRISEKERQMLREISDREHRSMKGQILFWIHKEHEEQEDQIIPNPGVVR